MKEKYFIATFIDELTTIKGRLPRIIVRKKEKGDTLKEFLLTTAPGELKETAVDKWGRISKYIPIVCIEREFSLDEPIKEKLVTKELPMDTQENLAKHLRSNGWTVYKRKTK